MNPIRLTSIQGVVVIAVSVSAFAQDNDTRDPIVVMENARQLVDEGKYHEALADLLWCFDEGTKNAPAFSGVRVSFLLTLIADLGRTYPPAMDALRVRRDAAQARASDGKGTSRYSCALMELAALNRGLGDDATNLVLYDELRAEEADSSLVRILHHYVADQLVKAGRFEKAPAPLHPEPGLETHARPEQPFERAWPRENHGGSERSRVAAAKAGYILDQGHYQQAIAAARTEEQRLSVLAERWDQVVLGVAQYNLLTTFPLHSSMRYWHTGWLQTGTWTVHENADFVTPIAPTGHASALIRGDCKADLAIAGDAMVHVYGDVEANISVRGQSEIVIGGDVGPNGSIDADAIVRIFVGGDVQGTITSNGMLEIWIHGDLNGEIRTGRPSTTVHVMGDFRGALTPLVDAPMLKLDVRGTMVSKDIRATARHGWTQFNASIGHSDMAPGIYPKSQVFNACWVVHSELPK